MKFRLDYVPSNLPDALQEILNGLTHLQQEELRGMRGDELASFHLAAGFSIRFAWSLWDKNTPLAQDCAARGLPTHPDDLSLAILQEAWAELCGG